VGESGAAPHTMTKSKREGWVRLGVGAILDACLWPVFSGLLRWSSYDREYRLLFVGGALAAAALVSVIPTFWRGQSSHAPFAFILLWLPGAVLFQIVQSLSGLL
jgi:hypothetical protein